ncbi:MAG: hypothetical protein CBB65_08135 [Hyphomonadaceae bacterium TMED5]|nr:hypothetical protein [Ponticaulis sp.]OUY00096.1 MAG: hypothetical protein CBB65_08135 [Hyphomonadaceae bacterium TMED5]
MRKQVRFLKKSLSWRGDARGDFNICQADRLVPILLPEVFGTNCLDRYFAQTYPQSDGQGPILSIRPFFQAEA